MTEMTLITEDIEKFFFNFRPLGALLRGKGDFYELNKTVDQVLIARSSLGLSVTKLDEVLNFISVINRFHVDSEFRDLLLKKQRTILERATEIFENLSQVNRMVLEGNRDLKYELERVLERACKNWVFEVWSSLKNHSLSADQETLFGDLLRDQLRNLESEEEKLLYYNAADLQNDKYLVYYLDIEEALAISIRSYLIDKEKNDEYEERERIVRQFIEKIRSQTSLLSSSWQTSISCDVDLTQFLCDQAKNQVFDFLVLESAETEVQIPYNLLEIVSLYSKAKEEFDSRRNTISTPDETEMMLIRSRRELQEQYNNFVLSDCLLEAPIVPETRKFLINILRNTIAEELSDESALDISHVSSLDVAGSLSIQRATAPELGDLSTFYDNWVWPAWVGAMAAFPAIAVSIILKNIIPSILSGAVSAYAMWCLLGRTETISPQLILGKNTRSKCVRVLDTVLKEMLRYRFYLFDSQNKELATKSAKILLKNFTDLATKATKLKDPALATDVEGLIALLNDELRLLSHKKTDTDFVASILERRNKFCNDMEVMSVIRNKAEEIVKEHLGIRERVYNRTDPLLNTLRAYPSIDKEGGVAVAETTANRVVIINGAYILTLSLRHFLAGLSGNNSQIYWYKNHITDLTRVIHEQGAVQKAMVENPNVEQHFNAPVGSVGNKGKINSSVGTQHNYAPEHKQNLAEAAAEIQKLLEQLEKSYPTETFSQKAVVAEETIKQIEADKNWKQKVINAVKAMGIEAFMEMIDNPVANVLRAGIEVWLEEDSD